MKAGNHLCPGKEPSQDRRTMSCPHSCLGKCLFLPADSRGKSPSFTGPWGGHSRRPCLVLGIVSSKLRAAENQQRQDWKGPISQELNCIPNTAHVNLLAYKNIRQTTRQDSQCLASNRRLSGINRRGKT